MSVMPSPRIDPIVLALEVPVRAAIAWRHLSEPDLVATWFTDASPLGEATLVTWTVADLPGGGSRIELVHDGWTEAGLGDAIREDHEAYWSGYLDDLRDILEDAVGS